MAEVLAGRLETLLPGGKGVWVPMDHGASEFPVPGLEDVNIAVDAAIEGGADAIVLHKGAVTHHVARTGWGRFVCHVSVSTIHGGSRIQDKVLVASSSECLARGALGVSSQVNLGDAAEPEMIERFSRITSESHEHGIPVLGMFYPRGENLSIDPSDPTMGIAHAARLAWELGCNVVKVPWTGSEDSFRLVSSAVPIPVLVSGGPKKEPFSALLDMVESSINAGGSGVCIGRQVFGAEDPVSHVRALRAIVHDGATASDARRYLE
jgi:DhnA family fructose-bisphosphate aldolase class Ia